MRLLILVLFALSCETIPSEVTEMEPGNFYKRDMLITYKGKTFEGTALLPAGLPAYSLEIEARGYLDVFTLTDCHKEWVKERAWNVEKIERRGPFKMWKRKIKDKRKVKFTYSTTDVSKTYCPIDLGGYEADKGRHSWGYVAFKPSGGLEADLACNGVSSKEDGAAICQAKKGLLQRITFRENVLVDKDDNCGVATEPYRGRVFEFSQPEGVCSVLFMDKRGREFRLDLIGYDILKIRSSKDD